VRKPYKRKPVAFRRRQLPTQGGSAHAGGLSAGAALSPRRELGLIILARILVQIEHAARATASAAGLVRRTLGCDRRRIVIGSRLVHRSKCNHHPT